MDMNSTQPNGSLSNEEPVYMRSRMRTTEPQKAPENVDFSRTVCVLKCNCHMLKHFENTTCIRNMKPFTIESEQTALKTINESIVKAISTVFDKITGTIKKNSSDDKKDK
ncbi:hypothetical protein NGRA_1160 [Nosema granulosis]|uniref:Uncharacterized protein n=1 Tax=Nosema granulosis TaxID=83296 RepID=A0A9P6H0L0_9MICR|nr:hypothetical protein NGRA_1160 [Nosema granulosis]